MPGPIGTFLRGVAMGAADIVPGVSGGTIALITGVYDRLLAAIASVDLELVRLVLAGQIKRAWAHLDASFLLALLLGIASSVLVFANLIDWWLLNYPQVLWAFFLGLVGASSVLVYLQELRGGGGGDLLRLLIGALLAIAIALSPSGNFLPGLAGFFLAGAIAICAMILPGISGSFILLLLGMYPAVISALVTPKLGELLVFISGCAVGLLSFSKLLHWLLDHHRRALMGVLTGFLAGSMTALWPWRRVVSSVVDRHGKLRPVQQWPVSPADFALEGGDPQLLLCVIAMGLGVAVVALAHVWAGRTAET